MTQHRPYQIRLFLREDFAAAAMRHEPLPDALTKILARHGATLDHNQLEEFESFVKMVESRPNIEEGSPMHRLYTLTKAALANPEKRSYFAREFTLSVGGKEILAGPQHDRLIAALRKLDGTVLTAGKAFRGQGVDVPAVRKSFVPKRHPGT